MVENFLEFPKYYNHLRSDIEVIVSNILKDLANPKSFNVDDSNSDSIKPSIRNYFRTFRGHRVFTRLIV